MTQQLEMQRRSAPWWFKVLAAVAMFIILAVVMGAVVWGIMYCWARLQGATF